jgi:hypothetical protein
VHLIHYRTRKFTTEEALKLRRNKCGDIPEAQNAVTLCSWKKTEELLTKGSKKKEKNYKEQNRKKKLKV